MSHLVPDCWVKYPDKAEFERLPFYPGQVLRIFGPTVEVAGVACASHIELIGFDFVAGDYDCIIYLENIDDGPRLLALPTLAIELIRWIKRVVPATMHV